MKKVISITLVFLLALSMVCPVHATVTPRYTYVDSIWACLSIDTTTGVATCEGEIAAKAGYPVKVVVYLQVYRDGRWATLKTWSAEGTYSAYAVGSYEVESGYTYRAYVAGYVNYVSGAPMETVDVAHTVDYPAT